MIFKETSPKLYRSYDPHRSRDSLSPVCRIFFYFFFYFSSYDSLSLTGHFSNYFPGSFQTSKKRNWIYLQVFVKLRRKITIPQMARWFQMPATLWFCAVNHEKYKSKSWKKRWLWSLASNCSSFSFVMSSLVCKNWNMYFLGNSYILSFIRTKSLGSLSSIWNIRKGF